MPTRKLKSLSLIFLGFLLIGFVAGWKFYTSRILSFASTPPPTTSQPSEDELPSNIQIPKVKVKIDIEKKSIVDGVWQISNQKASFLDISSVPGNSGNTVIYGHNKNSIFGPIRWLKVGDEIFVQNKSGEIFSYEVVESVVVEPDNISYVEPKNEEILTLYTCTGFMDTKRHIIVARPKTS